MPQQCCILCHDCCKRISYFSVSSKPQCAVRGNELKRVQLFHPWLAVAVAGVGHMKYLTVRVLLWWRLFVVELQPALHQCQLIVSEMLHFIQQVQYYINFEVYNQAYWSCALFCNKTALANGSLRGSHLVLAITICATERWRYMKNTKTLRH
jgi:Gamma tubulin complex component C-terminal